MVTFYERMFELDPTMRHLFRVTVEEQGKKLAQVIAIVVKSLDRMEEILPAVRELGARHSQYGVTEEHYATGGAVMDAGAVPGSGLHRGGEGELVPRLLHADRRDDGFSSHCRRQYPWSALRVGQRPLTLGPSARLSGR